MKQTRRVASFLVLLAGAIQVLGADDGVLDHMSEGVLNMHIQAQIIDVGGASDSMNVLWETRRTRQTTIGRAVHIRLQGSNVLLNVRFTPYVDPNGNLMIICQSEIWVMKPGTSQISYRTSIEALPVEFDEPLYFFPLGVDNALNVGEGDEQQFNIVLEVLLDSDMTNAETPANTGE